MSKRTKEFFLIVVLMLSPVALAQNMPTTPSAGMPSMQMTNIPYFSLRDGMSSTLTLNNLVPSPSMVEVTIFNAEGKAHDLPPMTLAPHSITELDLSKSVPDDSFDSGNIQISYSGKMMAVTAQVSIFSVDKRVDIESREQDMMDFNSVNLAGIASLSQPSSEAYVALTNVSAQTLDVQLSIGAATNEIKLSPRETQLVNLKKDFGINAPSADLVRAHQNGLPGDIMATAFVLDLRTGYSSPFFMTDPSTAGSSELAGAHFWFGAPPKAAGFPAATNFSSPLLLANVSGSPVEAQVSVDYDETEVSTGSSSPTVVPQHVGVSSLTIQPGAIQTVDLATAMKRLGFSESATATGVDITYNASPGSLIGHLTSSDATGDYSFEVPIKDPADMGSNPGGVYPWTLDGGTDTTLYFKNATGKKTFAAVHFFFPDGRTYSPAPISLGAYQTVAIDIQQLKNSRLTDINGQPFPLNETHGQVRWGPGLLHSVIGRAEQVNVGDGFARSFSCDGDCNCIYDQIDGAFMQPDFGRYTVGQVDYGYPDDYSVYWSYTDCDGNETEDVNPDENPDWSTTNPYIATVDNNGNATGVSAGTTYVEASWEEESYSEGDGYCIDNGQQNVGAQGEATVVGGPQILLNGCSGTNITNQTTNVVVGQQIVVCASPGTLAYGVSVSSYVWSLPGITVASYTTSSSDGELLTDVETNGQSATFFWPYAGTSLVVTVQAYLDNGIVSYASATFNVTSPSLNGRSVTLPNNGNLSVFTLTGCPNASPALPNEPALIFGQFVQGSTAGCPGAAGSYCCTAGIQFQPPSTPGAGQFFFVQLINSDVSTGCTESANLDQQYPYAGLTAQTVKDAPFVEMTSGTSWSRTFNATMYLMWQSNTANSIPVPLGSVTWSFSGSATKNGANWSVVNGSGGSANAFVAASGIGDFPIWTGVSACQ